MQQDIAHCRQKQLDRLCEVECCFHIAERYWAKLRAELSVYIFPSTAEEIQFFKYTKPRFTAEVEFYSLCYHAELFRKDVHDEDDRRKFWMRESQRLLRFIQDNETFYNYYTQGSTHYDDQFFVRKDAEGSSFPRSRVYDLEEKAATPLDSLVSTLLALEQYAAFVKKEMQVLHGDS